MTTWRGVTLDDRSAAMMTEVARLCAGITIDPTQGSYSGGVSASAGTHDGGGAIDIAAADLPQSHRDEVVYQMRRVGWAAWHRPAQSDWPHHIHGIAVQPGGEGDRGCLSSGAHDQVRDYYEGRNGLASGAPDDGPRDFVGATWEQYQGNPSSSTEEDDMFIAEAPARGAALMAPGYFKGLTEEERDVLLDFGVRLVKHNERGFDVCRAAMLQGSDSVNTD